MALTAELCGRVRDSLTSDWQSLDEIRLKVLQSYGISDPANLEAVRKVSLGDLFFILEEVMLDEGLVQFSTRTAPDNKQEFTYRKSYTG